MSRNKTNRVLRRQEYKLSTDYFRKIFRKQQHNNSAQDHRNAAAAEKMTNNITEISRKRSHIGFFCTPKTFAQSSIILRSSNSSES